MDRLIIRLAINAVALYVALGLDWLNPLYSAIGLDWVSGIQPENTAWWAYVLLGVIFGLVNALLRPILKLLTCPLIVLTVGLFTVVINGVLFWLTGLIGGGLGIGFTVAPWPQGAVEAILGGTMVGVVNSVLTFAFREERG